MSCPFGDPYCPCQDAMACHYVAAEDSPALTRCTACGEAVPHECEVTP